MVTIAAVEAATVRLALAAPVAIATRRIEARHYTLVRIACSDGTSGIGFCHGGTRHGGLSTEAVRHLFRPLLLGEDPHRTEGLWQRLHQDSLLNGRSGAVMRALSAIDIALWDRNARAASLPLWRYLGAFHTGSVPAYASGGYYGGAADAGAAAAAVTAELAGHTAAGFTAYKMKIGGAAPSVDAARVAAARAALGPDGTLLLDANNAWNDLASALRHLAPLIEHRPFLIEEPFGPDDLANHARLAATLPVAIATGEIVGGRFGHAALMREGGITVLQPDANVCGGITEFRRIAATAASLGVAVAPHSLHHLHLHLVAATPNALFVEYFVDDSIVPFRRLADRQTELHGGRLVLPETPGLGFDFDASEIARTTVDAWG